MNAIFLIAFLRQMEVLVCPGCTYTLFKITWYGELIAGPPCLEQGTCYPELLGTWCKDAAHSAGGSGPIQVTATEPRGTRTPFPAADLRPFHEPLL